jgi:PAS domain S-box-containing protein
MVSDLAASYAAALKEYLTGAREAASRRAYELGRRALAEGVGVLDMAALHHECVLGLLGEATPDSSSSQTERGAMNFFVESLRPYEMILHGLQEADAKLRHSLRELMLAEEALRRQNDKRMAANQALEEERKRYLELFEFAPDAYLVTDLAGNIRQANSAAAALLRKPKQLLAGMALSDFVMIQDRDALQKQLLEFRLDKLGKREDWQIGIKPANGPAIPLAVTIGAEGGVEGALTGLRWLLRDVTERKRAEEERTQNLRSHVEAEAARRFEFLSEASSLLASSLDYEATLSAVARLTVPYLADWCFVHLFEEDGSIYQLQPVHALGVDGELLRDLDRAGLLTPRRRTGCGTFAGMIRPTIIEEVEDKWLEDLTGDTKLVRKLGFQTAMAVPFVARERTFGALTLIYAQSPRRYSQADLSLAEDLAHRCALAIENARLYREVIRERDKAEKASRAKDDFLAILSHELKNPLMPVMNWTRILKNHPVIGQDSMLNSGVRSLERNVQNISRLVSDCLDLTRISQGKIEMKSETVDLNQIVLTAIEAVREMAAGKKLNLEVDLSDSSLWLTGDPTRLQQVVMNLLVNAIKYSESAGTIWIRSSKFEDLAEIEIKDTGVGIDRGFLEHIFEPFRQGTSAWLTSESGLGLGLAIARRIVEMHSGIIWAESQGLGLGSAFRVRMPLAAITALRREAIPAEPQLTYPAHGMRILIVEDSTDILFLLKLELEIRGFSVLSANDGLKGVEMAIENLPDLIISDIKMPGMDGYELIKRIRAMPELADTPAIALTGFGRQSDFEKIRLAGFDACVPKPADAEEILAVIQALSKRPP